MMNRSLLRRQCPRIQALEACRSRSFHITLPAPAEQGKDEGRESFRSQLYNSTFERVQREQAEQARYAAIRASRQTGGGGLVWQVPLRMHSAFTERCSS